ncbi:MAG: MEDS domain-containing protein [Nitrospira sp.]
MPVSGIRGAHNIRLGSHLCLFYRRPQEYLQVTASFLKAGIVKNEFCVWVLPPPLTIAFALDELLYCGLNGPRLQATKQLKIMSAEDCWFSNGALDMGRSRSRLAALPSMARHLGYERVRLAGGPGPFTSEEGRQAFMTYERRATAVIAESPVIALCGYASTECVETAMFDIMSAHPQALLRTHAGWVNI